MATAMGTKVPVIGSDSIVSEGRPIPLQCLPVEVGLRAKPVEYTCIDASQQFLAVGSAQGYVWVVDLQSSRLLREFGEFKGCSITVVKLNPVRDYVAYGTDNGFVRVERLSKVKPNKLRVQEKSGQSVNCIEWSQNGDNIFCGFDLGRLVQFNVKFKDGVMKHVPLYPEQYGSSVVQLSVGKSLLLVSTLDRAFVLDIATNKLDQIGRKERKSGLYGGCLVGNGHTLFVARPGLRIWIANELGKVVNTVAFKEALSSRQLPAIAINSTPTSSLCFSRWWQFSTLHPMLGGRFVVSFQDSAVFVLDPRNGLIVGAAVLESAIKSVSTSGGFLYILCDSKSKPIIRVAVHHSFVTMENESKRQLQSNQSTPCASVNSSPVGSVECLVKEGNGEMTTARQSPVEIMMEDFASQLIHDFKPCTERADSDEDLVPTTVASHSTLSHATIPSIHISEPGQALHHSKSTPCSEKELSSRSCSEEPEESEYLSSTKELNAESRIPGSLSPSPSTSTGEQDRKDSTSTCTGIEDTRERSRRVRMSQSAGDDIVADSKFHRKRRKVKGKKISSATSSASVSMERLADIIEDDQEQTVEISVGPVEFQCDEETDIVKNENDNTDPDLEASMKQEREELEDPGNSLSIMSAHNIAVGQLIDNDSGQQISSEVLDAESKSMQDAAGVSPTNSLITPESDASQLEAVVTSTIADSADDDPLLKVSSDGGMALGEVSDNPLYQDTDEDLLCESQDVTKESKFGDRSHHSMLQPALSDPLQDEEVLQTGTRPALQEPLSDSYYSSYHNLPARSQVTSWIDVTEKTFEVSDSSHDSEPESSVGAEVTDSQVVDDFYQLCGDLVKNTGEREKIPVPLHSHFSQVSISDSHSLSHTSRLCEVQDEEVNASSDRDSEGQSMDIWVSVPFPSRHTLQSVSLSDVLLWAVDTRGKVFHTTTSSRGKNWQQIKKTMQQVASSPLGLIVWGIHHQNAYVRLGIGMNPAGSTWKNITKNGSLAHKIKQLAVEENGVWAITIDNRVLFRKGVDERNPEGKVWQEVSYAMNFSFVSCCKNLVWALSNTGEVFVREGITPSSLSGKKWTKIKSPQMSAVSITNDGIVWGINHDGSVGFRTGINPSKPGGRGTWWEVAISSDLQALSPLNSLWQAMSGDGSHLFSSGLSSLVSMPHQHPVTTVSASSKAGVVVLEAGHKLHGCWRMATGYHYKAACKDGGFQLKTWSRMAAGGTGLWFVRNDGDLYCLSPGSKLKRVEVPSSVELIAASPNCMWVISKDMVWSRQGMTADLSEGISFDYIELSTLLHDKKLRSVACGKKVAWGIDSSGVPHFRFGVHAREPGTGMSPAWVPVEDHPGPLLQIAVCPDDWLVWACDEDHNVYVRSGVTVDFPVGRKWARIPKQKVKELAATSDRMYGLTPSGELMCRYGISENNVQGSFWRKMPGKYEHITTGAFGELWTLDNKGQVWKQEWKVIKVSDMHTDFDAASMADPESWEFI